jgi:multicomponent Na+:H+ antiporter subunit G
MMELLGSLLILLGAIFLFSAGVGLLRMPDTYTRIQAGTKATTLGNLLVLTGLAVYHPGWTFKLILAIYFVLMTNPVSSHALSRAAYRIRTPMTKTTKTDALKGHETETDEDAGAARPRRTRRRRPA